MPSLPRRLSLLALSLGLLAPPALARELAPEELLATHNAYRAEVGVPALEWSVEIAASAQAWADALAASGEFEHSTARYGENLWRGTAGAYSQVQMVESWGSEKAHFVYGTMPDVTDGRGIVGHYTQVVWRKSTKLGCGLATGRGDDVLVCQYDPPGNYRGEKPY